MLLLDNPPSQKDNGGEKNDKESKSGDNKEGKINIFLKAELPKAIIGEDLPNKLGNENRIPANHIKNPTDLNKQGLVKGGNENKPRSSNEKPDLIRNIANFKNVYLLRKIRLTQQIRKRILSVQS